MVPTWLLLLQDFHGRYYHPSNARFWFYGDDPADERLQLLSKYLDEFDARPVDSTVHAQPLKQVHAALCFFLKPLQPAAVST